VRPDASKISIKAAVEERFGVSVEKVHTVKRGPKSVRIGRTIGKTPGFKKALVRVAPGQAIDLT
jgi:large subunit ribosomal protein L23